MLAPFLKRFSMQGSAVQGSAIQGLSTSLPTWGFPRAFCGLALAWALACSSAALAAPAPKVTIKSLDALPLAEKRPYDTKAPAQAQVDAALARARRTHKRVLVDFGANWCPDCVVLANLMRLPEVASFVAAHYEVVLVDVGRFDKNQALAARLGLSGRLAGIPTVLIVDEHGKLLNAGHVAALADARSMAPQHIVDWLARWTAP